MIVTNGSTAPLLGGSDRPTSIRSSDIHSNRNDNYTSSSSGSAARKRSSLGILLFLTILSAIVTYLYDAVLAPYNMSEAGSSSISSLNSMATSNDIDYSRELPEEDVGGYVPSLEQRSVARTMNLEQRVSTIPIHTIRYMSRLLAPCVMM